MSDQALLRAPGLVISGLAYVLPSLIRRSAARSGPEPTMNQAMMT
jgi:hypothetical protein